jgi:hypothetical protein
LANAILNCKVPENILDKLKKEANRKNISMASVVRIILSEYFEELEKDVQK